MPEKASLRDEIIRLGPWHFDIEVADGLTTRVSLEAPPGTYPESFGPVGIQDNRGQFRHRLRTLYPEGLQGRRLLDCACNSGAYLFWARELGAGECFGSDVREHWIRQARFLQEHRPEGDGIRFEVMDVNDLPELDLEPFDITIFGGLFYHLADPVRGLKIAADLTKELLIFDTATKWGRDEDSLVVDHEGTEALMLGVHGLNWIPTGPAVVDRVMRWAGFTDTQVMRWIQTGPDSGRVGILASKRPGLLDVLRDG
ncbi:MAG: class I SAM-dependent methyltransferase [Solirubrobacterales bacterium]